MTTDADHRPAALEGIRVLDFTQMMLGPFATQILADLGADVIKIERPVVGEWERSLEFAGELVDGDSAAFVAMNRNKRSVAIDLKAAGAREALLKLAATCDVVVENFRPGVMDRLGLGYDDFRAVRPDIVYCSGSGWGQRTKYAAMNRPGQDLLIQAATGLAANTGSAADPPTAAGTSMCDATGALTLANGILAALLARARHGIGQRVEVDLFHATMAILCQEISAMTNLGIDFSRSPAGVGQPWLSAPFGIYRTADGWIALAMGDIGVVAEVFDDRLVAGMDPWLDRDAIKQRLDAATPTRATDDWLQAMLAAGLWAAPVRTMKQAMDELITDESDLVVEVEHAGGRTLRLLGCPITLSETPWRQRLRPPTVGEHTHDILAAVLDDAELTALQKAGAL
ncbi:CaiB/BaiF CoA-transferase family protein [Microlunatus sp. Gsoil 973]|uniref:CaiB/BaiF CoA transferase family protein n=1 Tax=Microlunatus sp. Gsoil 973 TaxID=2672569 RepID=UPI0012B4712E|nr:CoA transferase [Microlunatus sp. Gsoil 973]QGN34945.1 CoA transferase [Microlunatus sp. Gsoil 973]